MKHFITLLVLFTLFSCSDDESIDEVMFDSSQYPQKWELVKISAAMTNSEQTGNDMEWQEYYLLNSDSTFLRSRDRDGETIEKSGTFSFEVNESEELQLILTYNEANDLIGSCYGSNKEEELWVKSNTEMQNRWMECDGPGLHYKRIE